MPVTPFVLMRYPAQFVEVKTAFPVGTEDRVRNNTRNRKKFLPMVDFKEEAKA